MTFPPSLKPTDGVIVLWHRKADLSIGGPTRNEAILLITRTLQSKEPMEKTCAACLSVNERIEEHLSEAEQHLISILEEDRDLDGVTLLQLLECMQFNHRLRSLPASQRLLKTWSQSNESGGDLARRLLTQSVD